MPLPILWLVGAAAVGYAAKKIMEDDDSSSDYDDDSSDEEEYLRQKKAEKKAKKAEKTRKIKILEAGFSSIGEKYRHDITDALKNLVSLRLEKKPYFSRTLGDSFQVGSDQQILWANKYCTSEIKKNLLLFLGSYAVNISPDEQFNNISDAIDEATSAISDLKNKKLALKKMKCQLEKGR